MSNHNSEEKEIELKELSYKESSIINEIENNEENKVDQDTLFAILFDMGYEAPEISKVINQGILNVDQALEFLSLKPEFNVSCIICGTLLTQDNSFYIPECMDPFCKSCLTEYVKIRIEEGQVLKMPCPNHECNSEIDENTIKDLVSQALFEKYLEFRNNEELSKNPFLRFCPKPDCKGYDIGGQNKLKMVCNVCQFSYCYYCQEEWHPKKKCKAASDVQADNWARKNGVKYCPNCRRKVEKNLGCDHMTCVKCKYEWCWLCGDRYVGGHYDECEVRKLNKKDPPIKYVLAMIFCPLILPLLAIILCCIFVEKNAGNGRFSPAFRSFLMKKYISIPVAVAVGIVFTPVFFALAPFVGSIAICTDIFYKRCMKNCCGACNGVIFGIICMPLFVAVVVITCCIAHILGLLTLTWKLFIVIRRCKDPYYLLPKSKYGYI